MGQEYFRVRHRGKLACAERIGSRAKVERRKMFLRAFSSALKLTLSLAALSAVSSALLARA